VHDAATLTTYKAASSLRASVTNVPPQHFRNHGLQTRAGAGGTFGKGAKIGVKCRTLEAWACNGKPSTAGMSIFTGLVDFEVMATWVTPTVGFKPTVDAPSAQLRLLLFGIPILHVARQRHGLLGALFDLRAVDGDICNPVPTAALYSRFNTFTIEI
jgi:hypothetical protein